MRPTPLGNALEYSDQSGEISLGNRTTRMRESAWKDQREGCGERESMKSHWDFWRDVKERDSFRGNRSMSVMQIRRGVMSNSKPQETGVQRTEYPHVRAGTQSFPCTLGYQQPTTHRLVRRLATVTVWGAETKPEEPSTCPHDDSFLPATGFYILCNSQCSIHANFKIFAVKFQWFKCELFSIKKFGWPYKM